MTRDASRRQEYRDSQESKDLSEVRLQRYAMAGRQLYLQCFLI